MDVKELKENEKYRCIKVANGSLVMEGETVLVDKVDGFGVHYKFGNKFCCSGLDDVDDFCKYFVKV